MRTTLTPMRAEAFKAFAAEAIASYATDGEEAGRWPFDNAHERAHSEFGRLLPQGLETPDHYIYEIEDEALGQVVGFVWLAVIGAPGAQSGYVYSIHIAPELRGRGYAKAALDLIEAVAADKGLTTLALHVFSFNTSAQALYRSVGYGITGINMLKPLRRNGR
jgi:ribosomal protein S18 acetylase RimI-like enzyme